MLRKFKYWVIKKTFERYYGNYIYPFLNADVEIEGLSDNGKLRYYEAVKDWRESKAYKIEMNSLIRKFYQELSLKTVAEESIAGYRLSLIWLQNYERRLKELADKYEVEKITNKTINNLE